MNELYLEQRNEATRIAFLMGLVEALQAGDSVTLHHMLEPEAIASDLDSIIVLDDSGREVLGLQRVALESRTDYAVSSGTDMSAQVALGQDSGAVALLRTTEGYLVVITAPIVRDGVTLGQVLVGRRLARVLEDLRDSSLSQVALYGGSRDLLRSTFPARDDVYRLLQFSASVAEQVRANPGSIVVEDLEIAGYPYQSGYVPLVMGQQPLGVLGIYLPSSLPYATDLSRQLLSLLMAVLAASVVVVAYAGVGRMLVRIQRVTRATRSLALGDIGARTAMQATDEIGELGRSLDVYADRVQRRQESLRTMLRRQRRENARLTSVLESIPDGIIVQDLDGRVLLMNEMARQLLGSQRVFRGNGFSALTAVVTDVLGPALAPGIYALGEPQRIPLEEKVLSAQAAAILTVSSKRAGTVIVIRDITQQIQQEQAREQVLVALARDVQEPLMELVAAGSTADADPPLQRFAYEVMRNAVRLQRLVMQLRDLSDLGPEQLEVGQRPLLVDGLLKALVSEWEGTIRAANLTLQVALPEEAPMYVLGDERRLRWALGNLLDNAVKYTRAGDTLMLGARRRSENLAEITVRDTGLGISKQDKPHIFTRFYRGTPLLPDGTILRVPGMGQGLFIAHRVIEAHGGSVAVTSQPGIGTTVICSLPLTAPVPMTLKTHPIIPIRAHGEEPGSVPVDVKGPAARRSGPAQRTPPPQ